MSGRQRGADEDAAFRAWVAKAHLLAIDDVVGRLGGKALRDSIGGPCVKPGCRGGGKGPSDCFWISRAKNVFFCRATGEGGDPIALVEHARGLSFVEAVEFLAGERPRFVRPETDEERRAREERLAREQRERFEKQAEQDKIAARLRENRRLAAFKMWRASVPVAGTPAEDYLRLRRLAAPPGAHMRFHPDAPVMDEKAPDDAGYRVLWRGPMLMQAMTRGGRFSALHRTPIDLTQPKGKAIILDGNGEAVSSKKMLGSKKGASVFLWRDVGAPIERVFMGEGAETTLSVWCELSERAHPLLRGAEFRSAGDLGNMTGRARKSVAHPTLKTPDKNGVLRPKMVPGPEPKDDDDEPLIELPASCRELYLLGDGDSEPVFTAFAIERGAKRFSRAHDGLTVLAAMAAPGVDFNDMRLAERA